MLLQRLKTTPEFSSIPVIVVTSTSNPAQEAELIGLGASTVLGKPVSPAVMHRTLAALKRNGRECKQ